MTNEVGSGVVPATASGRRFRDELGRLNAAVAAECEHVLLVVAGQALALRGPAGLRPGSGPAPGARSAGSGDGPATSPGMRRSGGAAGTVRRMSSLNLDDFSDLIERPDSGMRRDAEERRERLTVPPGALGRLDELG